MQLAQLLATAECGWIRTGREMEKQSAAFQCSVNIVKEFKPLVRQKYKSCLIGLTFFHVVVDSFSVFRKKLRDRITINRRLPTVLLYFNA